MLLRQPVRPLGRGRARPAPTPPKPAGAPGKPRGTAIALECVLDGSPAVYFGDRYHSTGRYAHTSQGVMFRVMVGNEERVLSERLFRPCNPKNWVLFSLGHRLRYDPAFRALQQDTAA